MVQTPWLHTGTVDRDRDRTRERDRHACGMHAACMRHVCEMLETQGRDQSREHLHAHTTQRRSPQAPSGTRCTRLAYDDTRIVTGSLNGTVVVFDVL